MWVGRTWNSLGLTVYKLQYFSSISMATYYNLHLTELLMFLLVYTYDDSEHCLHLLSSFTHCVSVLHFVLGKVLHFVTFFNTVLGLHFVLILHFLAVHAALNFIISPMQFWHGINGCRLWHSGNTCICHHGLHLVSLFDGQSQHWSISERSLKGDTHQTVKISDEGLAISKISKNLDIP